MMIKTFEIEKVINGEKVILFPSLLHCRGKLYLIDCGYEETFENYLEELNRQNFSIHQIEGIIISHDDIDHLGGLGKFKDCKPSIRVLCGALEEPSVAGRVKSERLVQAENSLESLPAEHKNWAIGFIDSLKSIQRFEVNKTFDDGEVFEEEVQIVHTPGHTKGHISLFIKGSKTLIANDALVIDKGEFEIANPAFTLDLDAALASVQKIKKLKAKKIICYHGGIMEKGIEAKLDSLLSRYHQHETRTILNHSA
ncbi:MBL fold metallo-hydrolase [Algoriphagus sp.]|uniref:MBL fold metallo-hydrolase n=2 Tax=Algoriphagus sp. TaxID=1872435 RepID=UPI002730E0F9|nr:MBL fold metallo-hydrolase [Algoriphagus sp.]